MKAQTRSGIRVFDQDRDSAAKDVEILMLRHQLAVAQAEPIDGFLAVPRLRSTALRRRPEAGAAVVVRYRRRIAPRHSSHYHISDDEAASRALRVPIIAASWDDAVSWG